INAARCRPMIAKWRDLRGGTLPAGTDPIKQLPSIPAVAPSVFTEASIPTPPAYSSGFPRWWPNSCGANPGRVSPRLQAPALDRARSSSVSPNTIVWPDLVPTLVKLTVVWIEYRQQLWLVLLQPWRRRSNLFVQAASVFAVHPGRIASAF